MIPITAQHFIAGEPSQESPASFQAHNPRTKQPLGPAFSNATAVEIDRAATAAALAFSETRTYPADRLAAFLDRVAAEIEALGDQLLEVADAETGLGLTRLGGERGRTTMQLRKFAALLREGSYVEAIIDRAQPQRQPAPRPSIRRMLLPIGPVAVFAASNFPFAFSVAGGDTASAFAAGCPVVVKAHPSHPATSELFAQAIYRAIEAEKFPKGFFSLLQGEAIHVGQDLVTHPAITAVGFTGSLRAGRAIYDAAAARPVPIPVYAEMGSVNPLIVLPGALANRAASVAEGLVGSLMLGSGQFCTKPGLIFVIDSAESQAFIADVAARMAATEPGVLLNTQVELGLNRAVARTTVQDDVQQLTGGEIVSGACYCFANTVLQAPAAAFRANPLLQEEHFGPVTLFVVAESQEELHQTLQSLQGNLTATIQAAEDDLAAAAPLLQILREKVGRLIWNGFPTGVEVVYAMQHGGPYPATTAPSTTSVGMTAVGRFLRPVAFQNIPDVLLPPALQDDNPLDIWRVLDEQLTKAKVSDL